MRLNTEPAAFQSGQSIVLVGLMGAGKTAIGKRLAARIGLPFYDGDQEIEQAAGITISEIFHRHGEAHFRAGGADSEAGEGSLHVGRGQEFL